MHASMNWVIIVSDNGLSCVRRQAITCTSVGLLSIGTTGTSFSKIWITFYQFLWRKCIWKFLLPNWRPFCPRVCVCVRSVLISKQLQFVPVVLLALSSKVRWVNTSCVEEKWLTFCRRYIFECILSGSYIEILDSIEWKKKPCIDASWSSFPWV